MWGTEKKEKYFGVSLVENKNTRWFLGALRVGAALARWVHGQSAGQRQLEVGYRSRPVEDKDYKFR